MARVQAVSRKGGDFVAMQAGRFAGSDGVLEHLQALIGRGEEGAQLPTLFEKEGLRLEGEVVQREMGNRKGHRPIDRALPTGKGLSGNIVHQVDRDVPDAGCRGLFDRLKGFDGAMPPVEEEELVVIERLDPDAKPVDAGRLKGLDLFQACAFGVGLQRDFAIGGSVGCKEIEDLGYRGSAEEAGGAASKIDRHQTLFCQLRLGKEAPLFTDPLYKKLFPLFFIGDDVKMAIGTLYAAEGDVDVEAAIAIAGTTNRWHRGLRARRAASDCGR